MSRNLLVIGARDGSIGQAVVDAAKLGGDGVPGHGDWYVETAGISGEVHHLPLAEPLGADTQRDIKALVAAKHWHAVLCTVGVNHQGALGDDAFALADLESSFVINTLAPLAVLEAWLEFWRNHEDRQGPEMDTPPLHFAVLSSNSSRVVRSTGLPYCASKAALSMAVQCTARHVAGSDKRMSIYAYEPGWVEGTPMSQKVRKRLDDGVPASRTPGDRQLGSDELAHMIVNGFDVGGGMLNGCLLRVDGGES